MNRLYIITYDICDPARLRRVFKTVRDFGDHIQLSVFECQLARSELAVLRERLREIIHHHEDQVLFIDLGPVSGYRDEPAIETMGRPYAPRDIRTIIA